MSLSAYGMHPLRVADWPAADAAAWVAACNPRPGPFNQTRRLSPFTYRKRANGYGAYLWYLKCQNLLGANEVPANRVTHERLAGFFEQLVQWGNADYTIVGRFEELRGALQMMHPDSDFAYVTRPYNVSIRQKLPMGRSARFVPDFRHAVLWATALFAEALTISNPLIRQLQVRDAALMGIVASRAPRLRSLEGMRLGRNLIRSKKGWELFFDEPLMKGGQTILDLPLDPRVNAVLDRYIDVERLELLRGCALHDFVWVGAHGSPLMRSALEARVRVRTRAQYGVSVGPHRFRTSLTTIPAVVDGTNPLAPALVLGHGVSVGLKSYNRANNLAVSRRHDAYISAVEDAAARMLRRKIADA